MVVGNSSIPSRSWAKRLGIILAIIDSSTASSSFVTLGQDANNQQIEGAKEATTHNNNNNDDRGLMKKKRKRRHLRQQPQINKRQLQQSNTQLQTSSSHECLYHPDLQYKDGCTNNNNIDPSWLLDPDMFNFMFFVTSEECCNVFFMGNELDCIVRDDESCSIVNGGDGDVDVDGGSDGGGECVSPGWHADNVRRDGCTNGDNCKFLLYNMLYVCVISIVRTESFQLPCNLIQQCSPRTPISFLYK